jgi:hypothetical protein
MSDANGQLVQMPQELSQLAYRHPVEMVLKEIQALCELTTTLLY